MSTLHLPATSLIAACLVAGSATALTLDGQSIPTDASNSGLTLLATQDTQTEFGDANNGTQASNGSELDALWAGIDGGMLHVAITGNLEANFNKLWIFFDAVDGGENPLSDDNADGGFGEINALAGLSFDDGFTADHALRFEVGGGFLGVRFANLIDNVGGDIFTAGGDGSLPLTNVGSNGVMLGWDNSNTAGVEGGNGLAANDPLSATTGWELSIDMNEFFGATPSRVGITALITSGDGTFLSNQVLPGIGGGGNLGAGNDDTLGSVVIPEPASVALLGLGGLLVMRRRK